jgi:hypothetical protein
MTLRLDADDAAALDLVMRPGEGRTEAIRRCIRDAVPPIEWEVIAGKGLLFPASSHGVYSMTRAEEVGAHLARRGWRVRVRRVAARAVVAPDVEVDVGACPECDEIGGHAEGCSAGGGEE